jgi:hypothetical protein
MRSVVASGALAAFFSIAVCSAHAETVDLALVFEVSRSVDDDDGLKLPRQGYATAESNPRVLQAITAGPHGAIAICFIEWSGPEEQQAVAEWTVVRDGEGAAAFAATLLNAPRSFVGRTSINAAIDFSRTYLSKLYAVAGRQIIYISGDGTNNSGRPVVDARNEAVIAGVTINGLAIINEHPDPGYFTHTQPPGLAGILPTERDRRPRRLPAGGARFHLFQITNKLVNEIAAARYPMNGMTRKTASRFKASMRPLHLGRAREDRP